MEQLSQSYIPRALESKQGLLIGDARVYSGGWVEPEDQNIGVEYDANPFPDWGEARYLTAFPKSRFIEIPSPSIFVLGYAWDADRPIVFQAQSGRRAVEKRGEDWLRYSSGFGATDMYGLMRDLCFARSVRQMAVAKEDFVRIGAIVGTPLSPYDRMYRDLPGSLFGEPIVESEDYRVFSLVE